MTPQEMFIKLKGYIGHNLPCEFHHHKRVEHKTLEEYPLNYGLLNLGIKKIVPKLRQLESLTKQEMVKVNNIIMYNSMGARLKDWKNAQFIDGLTLKKHLIYIEKDGYLGKNGLFDELVDYFCELHIDYQDLIGQGLAISNVQNMHKGE